MTSKLSRVADLCQACHTRPVEAVITEDDPKQPYRVCRKCERRLHSYSLRPLEWFNLAALHGPWKYLLNDDFYGSKGEAKWPLEAVAEPERFPAPVLEQLGESRDLERLIDYAMTRHYLNTLAGQPVLTTLAAVTESLEDPAVLIKALQQRIAASAPNHYIEGSAYIICARCLGPVAQEWIRGRWQQYRDPIFPALAQASAASLPFEEAWERTVNRLEANLKDSPNNGIQVFVLASFRSPRVLDWIEKHRDIAVTDYWGRVAALSHFSWPRAQAWIGAGKPLSDVALAAIHACLRYDTPLTILLTPVLEKPAPTQKMVAALKAHAERDPAPDTRMRIDAIVSALYERA